MAGNGGVYIIMIVELRAALRFIGKGRGGRPRGVQEVVTVGNNSVTAGSSNG